MVKEIEKIICVILITSNIFLNNSKPIFIERYGSFTNKYRIS
ncbi:hypothetical protein M2451_003732 [Dysgonomonas sp. PFB1-18]|nr:hypothetical protein [Dysgonomonas sp. PF1-14]MDH6340770.1 hypothetical protein [Dysgonomonas sp. PF1-16]MDH6382391.1 hypothetical protein [Dysgonomonas sp. PFB1-18]MDH6399709.1 hypothetical protein [Dysgonomonas sp. PF1-23]